MTTRTLLSVLAALALVFVLAACGAAGGNGDGNGDGNGNGNGIENGDGNGNGNGNGEDNGNGNGEDDGNGNGNGDTAGVTRLGYVSLVESSSESGFTLGAGTYEVSGGGAFFETTAAIPGAFLADPIQEELETCEVFSVGTPANGDGFPEPPGGVTFTTLDAGTPLTVVVSGSGSTYATMERESHTVGGDTWIVYELEEGVTGSLPAGLALTVPGADFPAFSAVAFPNVGSFALNDPSDGSGVTVDTEFAWDSSSAQHAFVTLSVRSDDFSTHVTCWTADDGSFSFPSDTKSELGSTFSGSVSSAERTAARVEVNAAENAALVLSTTSVQEFGLFF